MIDWAEALEWFLLIFASDMAASITFYLLFERKQGKAAKYRGPFLFRLLRRAV